MKKSPRSPGSGSGQVRPAIKPAVATQLGKDSRNKTMKTALPCVAANDASFTVLDMSKNTVFAMKHRENIRLLSEVIPSNTHLLEIHLKKCELDKQDVKMLCDGVKQNQTIQVLDLEGNKIDNDGAIMIANMLECNWSIRELNLLGQSRPFGDPCLTAYVDMFEFNVTLTKIIWRLDSRKSFAINKLLIRNNTIAKNLQENRDVNSLIPSKCNVPSLMGDQRVAEQHENEAMIDEDDDDYCATVDLNAMVPAIMTASKAKAQLNIGPEKTLPAKKAPASPRKPVVKAPASELDDFEDDLYDEPANAPKTVTTKVSPVSVAPAPAAATTRHPDEVVADEDDDDWLDTVDLNAIVPAIKQSPVVKAAPKRPPPARRGGPPPTGTTGARVRAMSGRGHQLLPAPAGAPRGSATQSLAARPASKAPAARRSVAPPSMAKRLAEARASSSSNPPRAASADGATNASSVRAARAATASQAKRSAPVPRGAARSTRAVTSTSSSAAAPPPRRVAPAPKKTPPAKPAPPATAKKAVSLSVPPPNDAPEDAVAVYGLLSALLDRFNAVTDEDVLNGVGPELIQELARVRDRMIPLHQKYKSAGYMKGAVSKWRSLNTAIPQRVNTI